jgi:hypothetical protein
MKEGKTLVGHGWFVDDAIETGWLIPNVKSLRKLMFPALQLHYKARNRTLGHVRNLEEKDRKLYMLQIFCLV